MGKAQFLALGTVALLSLATEFRVQAYTRTAGDFVDRVDDHQVWKTSALRNVLFSTNPAGTQTRRIPSKLKTLPSRSRRPMMGDLSAVEDGSDYAESSRKYRRTVFMHPEWRRHRSSQRYLRNLNTLGESGVQKALGSELVVITIVAVIAVIINLLIGGYVDPMGVSHPGPWALALLPKGLTLPGMPFTISMPALALLLVFRTNTAYSRWNEARTLWGGLINNCRNVVRQANVFFPEDQESQAIKEQLAANTAGFCKALRNFLRGPEDDDVFRGELMDMANAGLIAPRQVDLCMAAKNRPMFMLNAMSESVRKANIDTIAKQSIDRSISTLVDITGANERIFKSPIPLVYTRHTSRFLALFLLFLPFGLLKSDESWNHLGTIPTTALLAFFLGGIEEIGVQLEEPFSVLPLEALCDGAIAAVLDELLEQKRGAFEFN